jgi:hypothetical protein
MFSVVKSGIFAVFSGKGLIILSSKHVFYMVNKLAVLDEETIKGRIRTIRGQQVILGRDLARLYEVKTGRLNGQVKRNLMRFPSDFMFQLSEKECTNLISQNAISRLGWGDIRKRPMVFTEQGVATLSGVLNRRKAI